MALAVQNYAVENAGTILELLEMLHSMGKTVIIVTHDERMILEGKRVISL